MKTSRGRIMSTAKYWKRTVVVLCQVQNIEKRTVVVVCEVQNIENVPWSYNDKYKIFKNLPWSYLITKCNFKKTAILSEIVI